MKSTETGGSCKMTVTAIKIIPVGATFAELAKQAADCEEKSKQKPNLRLRS
jgi:hypothetical protein